MTRTPRACVLAVLAVLGVTACGQQSADVGSASGAHVAAAAQAAASRDASPATSDHAEVRAVRLSAGQAKPRLVCPTRERSMMIADFAEGGHGAATPEEAVGDGLVQAGEHLVISARGRTAWVLRADGTARMEIGLLHEGRWFLHQRTSCG
jgi:hypothetical protein